MVYVLALLLFCSLIGSGCETKNISMINPRENESVKSKVGDVLLLSLLLITLVVFSGLRTVGNDTALYIKSFTTKTPDSLSAIPQVDWAIGSNPLFTIYSILIKVLISSNPQVFIFISAIIVQVSLVLFMRKYSADFGFALFTYIAFTVYAFTMAAMKQTLATAIAIWAVPMIATGKKLLPLILILVSALIHPYVVIILVAFLFRDNVWDKKTAIVLTITIVISIFLQPFLEGVLNITSEIGDKYDVDFFAEGTGVNLLRVAVYCVVPIMAFVFRDRIRKLNNNFYFICINLSIVSMCFMFLGLFGGANMFGRMANYFDIFYCVSLTILLKYGTTNSQDRTIIILVAIFAFCFFYYTFYKKNLNAEQYTSSWISDFYKHVSILELFK